MTRTCAAILSLLCIAFFSGSLFAQGVPAINIETLTNGVDADTAPGPTLFVGASVTWTYLVTNLGEVTLTNVFVNDDHGLAVGCPKLTLESGESMTCVASGVATAGQYANVGTAGGVGGGISVSDTDPSHYFGELPGGAAISIEKWTNGEDSDLPLGRLIVIGDPVVWTYLVTNSGAVALTGVSVTDDHGVVVTCPRTALDPGESMTCVASAFAEKGQYANVGTSTGNPASGGDPVSDIDSSHYFGVLGLEGCGLGYWKKHTQSWPPTGYSPSQMVTTVFPAAGAYPTVGNRRLGDALSLSGGRALDGAAEILVRAAVAALLDAAHPNVAYPWTEADVIGSVNGALSSQDRQTMLELAELLDVFNRLDCPLD